MGFHPAVFLCLPYSRGDAIPMAISINLKNSSSIYLDLSIDH
jgi:hypothetical protein